MLAARRLLFKVPRGVISVSSPVTSFLVFSLFGLLCSRGLMEKVVPKSIAMMGQLIGVMGCCCFLLRLYRCSFSRRMAITAIVVGLFAIVCCLSGIVTSVVEDFHYWIVYVAFSLIVVGFGLCAHANTEQIRNPETVMAAVCVWGWVLFGVSILEQLRMVVMDGSSVWHWVRPASITGSFLHYPIIIALLGFIVLQWWTESGRTVYLLSAIVFFFATLMAFSRSGMLIVVAGLGFYGWRLFLRDRVSRKRIVAGAILSLCLLLSVLAVGGNKSFATRVVQRLVHAVDPKAIGNGARMATWKWIFYKWSETNLLIGERAGMVTNSTRNFVKGKSTIAESSVLQQLNNFGVIGLLLYYLWLIRAYGLIRPEHGVLRAAFGAAILQTCVYQSIEVIPFIILLLLLPWLSACIAAGAKEVRVA